MSKNETKTRNFTTREQAVVNKIKNQYTALSADESMTPEDLDPDTAISTEMLNTFGTVGINLLYEKAAFLAMQEFLISFPGGWNGGCKIRAVVPGCTEVVDNPEKEGETKPCNQRTVRLTDDDEPRCKTHAVKGQSKVVTPYVGARTTNAATKDLAAKLDELL